MTILIADDFPTNRNLLRVIFEREGFQVAEAADGVEALRLLGEQEVDAIISDILMPRMDGYRLCTEIRRSERWDKVPFVFHTSTYTSPSDEALALKLGADKFIRKPATPRLLVDTIRGLLDTPSSGRCPERPPAEMDPAAEYTQRLVAKLEEKNEALFNRTQEARKAGDELSALILAAPVAIISFDASGVIRIWNPAAERIFGWTAEEIVGRHPRDVLGEALDGEDDEANLRRPEAIQGVELTRRRRDGSEVHVEMSAAPLHDDEGNVSGRMAVFADITVRKTAEEALEKAKARMEILSRRLLATGEAELRRIARELHDEIGQGLTAAKLAIEASKTAAGFDARGADPIALGLHLDDGLALIEHLLQSVRTLSLDLRPASLDELGLVTALRTHVYSQAARAGLSMHFAADDLPRSRNPEVEIACFRVAQEALTNIIRHAHATSVEIDLKLRGNHLKLTVEDNGKGFDEVSANVRAEQGCGFGLLSMRERAQLAGGSFTCISVVGRGTKIEASFPWI